MVGAESRPERRSDEDVALAELGRAETDSVGEQRVGEERQVLAVLLQRADREKADRAGRRALVQVTPGHVRELSLPHVGDPPLPEGAVTGDGRPTI